MTYSPLNSAVACARALGHPARLRILAMLEGGALCPCQITEVLGLASSTISAHLRELRRAGLTEERKEGRWVYVSLNQGLEAVGWLELSRQSTADDPQLAADRELVAQLRELPIDELCRMGLDELQRMHRQGDGDAGGSSSCAPEVKDTP